MKDQLPFLGIKRVLQASRNPVRTVCREIGRCRRMSVLAGILVVVMTSHPYGQSQSPGQLTNDAVSLTLDQAVEFALSHYPAVKAVLAQAAASHSGVDLARTAYLPRTDLVWQANRATRNNVFGLFFPQPIPLPISGPVLGTNNGTNVWGTATGFLFNWEPFDLGLRKAQVGTARAQEAQAKTAIEVTRQDVAVAAADGFLTLLASQQAVRVAQASVDRARVLANTIDVLVKNELRPGADASRAKAELAAAETQLIQAQQSEQISRATLAQLLGVAGTTVTIKEGPLLQHTAFHRDDARLCHDASFGQLSSRCGGRGEGASEGVGTVLFPQVRLSGSHVWKRFGRSNQRRNAGGAQRPRTQHLQLGRWIHRKVPAFRFLVHPQPQRN